MARNVEIKIQVNNLESVRKSVQSIANRGPFTLQQVDYFFPVANGRLKLRVAQSDLPGYKNKSELIAYQRSDEARGRTSNYEIHETDDWQSLYGSLVVTLGEGPIVRKNRELYLTGKTRIHLDTVEGLGTFVEIEVVMDPQKSVVEGHRELQQLMTEMNLQDEKIVDVAYADLISAQCAQQSAQQSAQPGSN